MQKTEQESPSPENTDNTIRNTQNISNNYQTLNSNLTILSKVFLAGIYDALAFGRVINLVYKSKKTQTAILNCFFLNGLLLLGSYFMYEHAISPGIKSFIQTEDFGLGFLHSVFTTVYYSCWVFPVYVFSYVVNLAWYSDIAYQAFVYSGHTAVQGPDSIGKKVSDIVYDLALCGSFIMVTILAATILNYAFSFDTTSEVFKFIQLSWLYSFYCFDCKWSLRGKWGIAKRVQVFENYWVYMLGFGTPFTLAFFFFPYLVSNGIFALLYPLFIILAVRAKPQKTENAKYIPTKLPIFWMADKLNHLIFCFISAVYNYFLYNGM